jgi:hypothetical protein
MDIAVRPPTSSAASMYSGDSKMQISRLLLSHLGLLSPENRSRVRAIPKTELFFNALKQLDQLPE